LNGNKTRGGGGFRFLGIKNSPRPSRTLCAIRDENIVQDFLAFDVTLAIGAARPVHFVAYKLWRDDRTVCFGSGAGLEATIPESRRLT
jgi:hypothetical protein